MIAWAATYLIWVMVAGYLAVWIFAEGRRGKLTLGFTAVVGLVIVLILIVIAGKLHNDPRPFVDDPSLVPLIPHAPDNGFPSDHSSAAGLIAAVIALRHRWYGALLGIAAIAVAWARVAAHVHHVQDVVAGLVFGVVAALIAALIVRVVFERTRLLSLPLAVRWLGAEVDEPGHGAHRDTGGPTRRR